MDWKRCDRECFCTISTFSWRSWRKANHLADIRTQDLLNTGKFLTIGERGIRSKEICQGNEFKKYRHEHIAVRWRTRNVTEFRLGSLSERDWSGDSSMNMRTSLLWGARIAQWFSTGLRAGWSGILVPAGAGNFSLHHRVQTGSGAHPASYPVGTRGSFPRGRAALDLHLVNRSRMREALPPLLHTPSKRGAQLKKAQGQLYLLPLPVIFMVVRWVILTACYWLGLGSKWETLC
jgi:hypothetical protein